MNSVENKSLVIQGQGSKVENNISGPISNLPEEILFNIFSECGCKGLGKLAQVNQHYSKATHSPLLWKVTLLKEIPNLFDDYPCLNNTPPEKIRWKKVYLDEASSNIDVKWKGADALNVAYTYMKNKQLTTRKKWVSLDLNSNELTLNIFKKIALNELELSHKPNEVDIYLGTHKIIGKNNIPLKEIKISGPSILTFMDFVDNDKGTINICVKKEAPSPEEILPKEWEVGSDEQPPPPEATNTIQNITTKKKKKSFFKKFIK